uniref:Uncharacterized protein n=1 Tax=Rhizophora mucronata TaxID=61149 RepID=A0A2P2QXG1_RHIMU
MTMVEKYRS